MSRLEWGAISHRYYEGGVDRGVLYTENAAGVAWSGLISVSERPTGGEPKPYYFDGVKYLNIASTEEFEATIDAVSAPLEFNLCDGVASVHNGLFATQQPRRSFGLSYRSLIGNPFDGLGHAYKIHLVYNALAAPAQRRNQTVRDSSNPIVYSWRISTLAPSITGFKRTAHLVIDSRYADPEILSTLEDILYGTETESPSLPLPDDLVAIFDA